MNRGYLDEEFTFTSDIPSNEGTTTEFLKLRIYLARYIDGIEPDDLGGHLIDVYPIAKLFVPNKDYFIHIVLRRNNQGKKCFMAWSCYKKRLDKCYYVPQKLESPQQIKQILTEVYSRFRVE